MRLFSLKSKTLFFAWSIGTALAKFIIIFMSDNTKNTEWPLWEVFYQPKDGKPFEHAGSVHAPDAEMALQNARDTYARRNEGIAFWIVPSDQIIASTPEDVGPFFDPANDKPYRHPQFYSVPRAVKKRK